MARKKVNKSKAIRETLEKMGHDASPKAVAAYLALSENQSHAPFCQQHQDEAEGT